MSLKDLLGLSPVPGLDAAVTLLTSSYNNIQNISVYRKQCEEMANRCVSLILSLRDGAEGLEGTKALRLADELEPILEQISFKTREWAEWGPLKSFLQQGDLRNAIDALQRQLDAALLRFGVAMKLEMQRNLFRAEHIQQATREEFRAALQAIMENQSEFKKLLAITSPEPVEQVMECLQTELQSQDPHIPEEQTESFRKGLWALHSKTAKLPPLTDLSGQVTLESRHPEFIGTYNDVYIGKWLDREKVAVRLPKTLSDSRIVHQKFQQEVGLWRQFDHPNVLPLYGIVYLGRHLYSVSPWMENGTAISFVQQDPQANRLKMLTEIAEGLAYLHAKKIVHGDLRGANVLISDEYVARLSDFGLSKFLQDCNKGLTSASSINPRWFAPEILDEKPLSMQSDIWSLGMTFLELLTGQQPFSNITHDFNVMKEIKKWRSPLRPEGLSDELWYLLKWCWEKPGKRPTIQEVQDALAVIRGERSPDPGAGGPKKRLSMFRPSRTSSSSGRPGTGNSVSSENSSNSSNSGSRMTTSLRGLSIHSIPIPEHREHHDYGLSPLTPSPQMSSSPSSYASPLASSPRQYSTPTPSSYRRPSQASETQPTRNYTVDSKISLSSTPPREGMYRDMSSAPRLEVPHLDPTYRGFERDRAPQRPVPVGQSKTFHTNPRSILTVETMNEEPLLLEALSDRECIVYADASGVLAGNLQGLVERLVENFSYRKDEEFREVILTACIDFITPEDLFNMLQWRFDEAEQDLRRHPADRVATQYNVFMVLAYWLSSRQLPVDDQLLRQMRQFCETAIRMKSSSTMVDKAEDLLRLIDQRPQQDVIFKTPLTPGRRIMTADQITPHGLAIALTLLEGDKFKAIMPCDYLAKLCNRPGFNNVDVARLVNNKIIQWVKESLLHYDALQARAAVLKFFVNTANECRKLRNYQSLIAIAVALGSTPVQSMELTKNLLSPNMVAQLEALVDLPSPGRGNDHSQYRKALQEAIDPTYRDFCVPWIAVHLKELHSVLHLNKRVVEIKGRPLVNFERYTKFLAKVKSVFPQPPPDLERYRHEGQLAYLENKLAGVTLDDDADDRLVSRSRAVQSNERVLQDLKVPERMKLGFKVPKAMKTSVTG